VLVGRLGRKIEQDAGAPSLIVTVAGAGYKFAPPVSPATDEVCFGPPFSGLV
jgi:DNA-binding winged helix-turn-helix (wHTH) protein